MSVPTEHEEQAALMEWAELESKRHPELAMLFAIPNGANKSWKQAKKFKAEGLKSGVPDICLPVPSGPYHGLFLEMKRTKGSVVSDEQKQWIHNLRLCGYWVDVCKGWEHAKNVIIEYLGFGR